MPTVFRCVLALAVPLVSGCGNNSIHQGSNRDAWPELFTLRSRMAIVRDDIAKSSTQTRVPARLRQALSHTVKSQPPVQYDCCKPQIDELVAACKVVLAQT